MYTASSVFLDGKILLQYTLSKPENNNIFRKNALSQSQEIVGICGVISLMETLWKVKLVK